DRRRREVLTIDPEPVAGTAGEVEEALRVPVAEIAGPVDAVAHAFGVGFGIVVITLEAAAAVGVHDLADRGLGVEQPAGGVEDRRRAFFPGLGVEDDGSDRSNRQPERALGRLGGAA